MTQLSPNIDDGPDSAEFPGEWTAEILAVHQGTCFEMFYEEGKIELLTLVSVTPSPALRVEGGRIPFSLIFRSDRRDFHLPQACRVLRHPVLGPAEIFLVPIGPDGTGMCYEAIFN